MPPNLLNSAYREHVMLLYHADEERNASAVDFINEGLRKGHLCIYASVGAYDGASKWHYSNLSSKIENYEENVREGNLVIVDFKPFFEAARRGDPTLFNQLTRELGTRIKQRVAEGKGDKVLAFADAACTLSEHGEFEECAELEKWWQNAHIEWSAASQNVTVICPHPASVFSEKATASAKAQIAAVHSMTLQARPYNRQTAQVERPIRVLILEQDPDTQNVYRRYLDTLGLEVRIVSEADECMQAVFSTSDSEGFDMVILDTHLKGASGIEVARRIRQRLPDQRIVVTSTTAAPQEIASAGIREDHLLQKPFTFSKLLSLIRPATGSPLKR